MSLASYIHSSASSVFYRLNVLFHSHHVTTSYNIATLLSAPTTKCALHERNEKQTFVISPSIWMGNFSTTSLLCITHEIVEMSYSIPFFRAQFLAVISSWLLIQNSVSRWRLCLYDRRGLNQMLFILNEKRVVCHDNYPQIFQHNHYVK